VKPSSVLVMRICCLGDLVFATPLLRCLRAGLPHARLGLLVGGFARPLLKGQDLVDEVVEYAAPWPPRGPVALAQGAACMRRVGKQGWDCILVTHRSLGVRALARFSGIPRRIGFVWRGDARFLTESAAYSEQGHESARFLALAKPLGLGACLGAERLSWSCSPGAAQAAEALLAAEGLPTGAHPVILLPGGGSNPGMSVSHKRWPMRGWAEIARRLADQGAWVVCMGAGDDAPACAQAAAAAGSRGIDLCGKNDRSMMAGLLARGRLVLGNDTGGLHLAEALGVPTVGLYGPTLAEHYGPVSPGHLALHGPAPACAPCLNPAQGYSREGRACARALCMEGLDIESVWRAIAAHVGVQA